ncbi:MAG: transglutaminase-like domain-containing protein [Planctomycetota bacterium]|nr:transglutaminase-like domain-containing protein [Planctomycetota bacterium]
MAASKTLERRFFPFFAPAYAVCLVLALRAARARLAPMSRTWRNHLSRAALLALLGALLLGFCGAWLIRTYGRELPAPGTDFARALQGTAGILGFTDSPVLGSSPSVARSLVRVLRVETTAGGQEAALSAATHLRGAAYETYSRGRWERALGARRYSAVTSDMLHPEAAGARLRITRLMEDTSLVFTPLHCAGIDVTLQDRQHQPPLRFETDQGGSLFAVADSPFEYDIVMGGSEFQEGPLCVPPAPKQRERCLQVPEQTEMDFRILADEIAGGIRNPRDRIAAVENYLRANHAYSLTAESGTGDPLLSFLLEKKAAHCEYFASAAVILLRCVDVPTRYVTGFYVHETAGPRARVVRQQDAHAWAEAWVDSVGWVTVDATPPAGRPDQLAEQPSFWRRLSEGLLDLLATLRRQPGAWVAAAAAVAAGAWFFYWRRRRAMRRLAGQSEAPAYTPPSASVLAVARQFEEILRKRDIPCPPQTTWSEHLAVLVAGAAPHSGPSPTGRGSIRVRGVDLEQAAVFLQEYNAVRFGNPGDVEAIARAHEALKQLVYGS